MAAGTKVCQYREHRTSTVPSSKQSGSSRITDGSLLKSFTQHHLWRVLPYPPTRNCFTVQMCPVTRTSQVSGGGGVPLTASARNYSRMLKVKVFGCLFEPKLKSISTVQMHLNRVFFPVTGFHKPLCFPLLGMCLGKSSEPMEEMNQEVTAMDTTTENPDKDIPGNVQVVCGGGDAMAGECGEMSIHPPQPATPPPEQEEDHHEVCYESEDSDCEYDSEDEEDIHEFGYESDNDDCVEFSDEADMPEQTCLEDAAIPKSQHYTALFSVESGYCDLANESFSSCEDEWSENESDDSNFEMSGCKGDKASEMLWKHFEMQALSPVICGQNGNGTECLTSCCDVNTPTMNCVVAIGQTCTDVQHDLPIADKVSKPQLHQNPLKTVSCADHSESENDCASNTSLSSNQSARHVSFKSDLELVVIHHIIAWDFAYRAARKGPWEQYARDRMHFRRRIDSLAPVLEPCLARKLKSCVAVL